LEIIDKNIVDNLHLFITKLNDASKEGALIVVEGKRDVEALRTLGFNGDIFQLCQGGSIIKLVQMASKFNKAVLLFDLDREGRSLTKKSAEILNKKQIPIDLFFRRELRSITLGRVRRIENLKKFGAYFDFKVNTHP